MKRLAHLLAATALLVACGTTSAPVIDKPKPAALRIDQPEPGRMILEHDGLQRTFLLHLPRGRESEDGLPLVLALHGFSSDAPGFEQYSQWDYKADREGFIVIYPEGMRYPWDQRNPRAWSAGGKYSSWTVVPGRDKSTDDVGFIAALIDWAVRKYAVDEKRIFATGHSNGSRMTYRLGAELADRIAAIAPHSGQMLSPPEPPVAQPVPVLHLHALDDTVVPYDGQQNGDNTYPPVEELLKSWAAPWGGAAEPTIRFQNERYTVKEWKCGTPGMEVVLFAAVKGGHAWFTEAYPGVAANEVIWDFFKMHPKQ